MTDGFVGHFDACLGCMACVTACPSGVEYAPLVEATRAQIERRYDRSLGDRLFRSALFAVIPYPARLRLALAPLVVYGWIRPLIDRSGLLNLLPRRVRALARLAPPMTVKSLTASTAEVTPAVGAPRMRVGLLTGCVQRLAFAHVNDATVRVLAAEGCEVVGSAGAGLLRRARPSCRTGRRTLAPSRSGRSRCSSRPGVERIVVNAAGCGSSMKEYERLFAGDPEWAARARAFSARVRDVNELLIELGEPQGHAPPPRPSRRLPRRLPSRPRPGRAPAAARSVAADSRHRAAAVRRTGTVLRQRGDLQPGAARARATAGGAEGQDTSPRCAPIVVATANPGCTLQIASIAAEIGPAADGDASD